MGLLHHRRDPILTLASFPEAEFSIIMTELGDILRGYRDTRGEAEKRQLLDAHMSSFQAQLGWQASSVGNCSNSEGAVVAHVLRRSVPERLPTAFGGNHGLRRPTS